MIDDLFGTLLLKISSKKGISIDQMSKKTGITDKKLRQFINNKILPLPDEFESIVSILDLSFQESIQLRKVFGMLPTTSGIKPKIEVLREEPGGLHPWAIAIFQTEHSTAGPCLTASSYLGARTRPINLTLKHYEWDNTLKCDLEAIRDILIKRRQNWLNNLRTYSCRDIYPKKQIEQYCMKRIWFGHKLTVADVVEHLLAIEDELRNNENYQISLLSNEELYFNFLIQGGYVLLEGGYEIEPKAPYRCVGGLRISDSQVVEGFIEEFERMWYQTPIDNRQKDSVIAWFRDLRLSVQG